MSAEPPRAGDGGEPDDGTRKDAGDSEDDEDADPVLPAKRRMPRKMKSVLDVCAPRGKNRKVNPPPPPPVIIPEEDDIANADSSYLDSLMQLEQAATDGNNVEFRAAPGSYLEHVMQLEQEEMDRDAALRTLPVKETFDADDGLVENEDDSGKPEDDTGKLEDDEGYDAREDMLIEEVTKPIPVPGDDQHPNIPKFINGCRVKIAENVETADIDAGTIVFLDCPPPEKISPVGHPVTALADAIAAIGRKLPTDADVNGDGVTFQMGQIDYIVAPPVPGNPMPRWVSEISTEPLPNKPPMLPVIRMFGCTENELSVHLRIHAFEPYMFVRLPDGIDPAKDLPSAKELRRRLDIRAHAAAAAAHATASGDLDSMPEWKKRKMSSASQADTPIVVRVEISPKIPLRGVWYHLVPFLRITTCLPKHVPIVRGMFERTGSLTDAMPPLKCYEADVPFPIRFLVDRGITGCDWIRIPKGTWVREQHDQTHPLDREGGGYCERRKEAERRVTNISRTEKQRSLDALRRGPSAARDSYGDFGGGMCRDDDGCEFGSQEERDCNTLGSDWGDPFGMVVEDAQGRCAPPWGVSSDRKRRFGRWGAKRPVLRRIEKCGSDESRCSIVVDVAAEHVMPLGVDGAWAKHAPQRILSHDTEWIGKGNMFPEEGKDPLVSMCFSLMRSDEKEPNTTVALQLSECDPVPGARTIWFDDEKTLLMAFRDLFITYDPDIVTGYNTNNFDWPYLIERAKILGIEKRFCDMSRVRSEPIRYKRGGASFTSKAAVRSVDEVDISGIMIYDMCVAIMAEEKLPSYQLNAVSATFLGRQKRDVGYKQLPVLQRGTPADRCTLADYCCEDTRLPLLLATTKVTFLGAAEMARATRVPADYLLKRGQGIKVSSQIWFMCRKFNMVMDSSERKEVSEMAAKYQGATVLDPKTGFYDVPIPTLDFASLYPSIMMAHNLCLGTLLSAAQRETMNPKNFEVTPIGAAFVRAPKQFDAETLKSIGIAKLEELGLEKNVHYLCDVDERRPYLKTPGRIPLTTAEKLKLEEHADYELIKDTDPPLVELNCDRRHGVLPRILNHLLAARGAAKKQMAAAAEMKNATLKAVFNGRQLALKICANSVYGVTGAQVGRTSQPEIAASVTAYGRDMIEMTKNTVEKEFGGDVKYGDSVAGDTPILISRCDGSGITFSAIEDLQGEYVPYHDGKEAFIPAVPIYAWSDVGWTRVNRVIRHAFAGKLVHVETGRGYCWMTDSHGLVRDSDGSRIDAETAAEDHVPVRHFSEYPKVEFEPRGGPAVVFNTSGTSWNPGDRIVFGSGSNDAIHLGAGEARRWGRLWAENTIPRELQPMFRTHFGNRPTIPDAILNGTLELKNAFIDGWSDGGCPQPRTDMERACVMALFSEIGKSGGLDITDADNYDADTSGGRIPTIVAVRPCPAAVPPCYVYDLETEIGRFAAGAGQLVVHNTDSVMVDFMIRLPIGADIRRVASLANNKDLRLLLEAAVCKSASDVFNKKPQPGDPPPTDKEIATKAAIKKTFDDLFDGFDAEMARVATEKFSPESGFVRKSDPKGNSREIRTEFNENVIAYATAGADLLLPRLVPESVEFPPEVAAAVKDKEKWKDPKFPETFRAAMLDAIKESTELDQIYQSADIGKKAAAAVTKKLPFPSQLAFEKVFRRWLLVSKKRYADVRWVDGVMYTKISSSGLETKRRDNCPLVKTTINGVLGKVMMKDDIRGSVAAARESVLRVRARDVSLDELIITQGYVRHEEDYLGKQKHTEVVKKMRKRDPATAPRIGQRVEYVMVAKPKGAKGFEKAEDPIYVMKNGCPIDSDYYIENQLRKPLTRILSALVPDPDLVFSPTATIDDILDGRLDHQRRKDDAGSSEPASKRRRLADRGTGADRKTVIRGAPPSTSPGSIGKFLVRTGQACLGCGANVRVTDTAKQMAPATCYECLPDIEDIKIEHKKIAANADAALQAALAKCKACEQGHTRGPAKQPTTAAAEQTAKKPAESGNPSAVAAVTECENSECPHLYVRAKVAREAANVAQDMERFNLQLPPLPLIEPVNPHTREDEFEDAPARSPEKRRAVVAQPKAKRRRTATPAGKGKKAVQKPVRPAAPSAASKALTKAWWLAPTTLPKHT